MFGENNDIDSGYYLAGYNRYGEPIYKPYTATMIRNMKLQQGYVPATRRAILNYVMTMYNAREIVQVDSFETLRQRHICQGSNQIILLEKQVCTVPTLNGDVNVELFYCPRCGKLIVNKESTEFVM